MSHLELGSTETAAANPGLSRPLPTQALPKFCQDPSDHKYKIEPLSVPGKQCARPTGAQHRVRAVREMWLQLGGLRECVNAQISVVRQTS